MQTTKQSSRRVTLVMQACAKVHGFDDLFNRLKRRMKISGRSKSTLENYSRNLAQMALHFNALPTELDEDQIENYLYLLQQQHNTPSETYFKHTVFGLRFLFRMEGLEGMRIALPPIGRTKKLPVVLSRKEVKRLLHTPALLKHRILFALLYDCGLRCMEVRRLQLKDIDMDRRMLHIRQSKGKKDRYVPIGNVLAIGLQKYIETVQPVKWLFNGRGDATIEGAKGGDFDSRYAQRSVQYAVSSAVKQAGINKDVSVHTLRHTYATHLLEAGTDIMTIQKLLGHSNIDTTMIYLHVMQPSERIPISILDQLYDR